MTANSPDASAAARFQAFFAALAGAAPPNGETLARAFLAHLASLDACAFPQTLQPAWEHVLRTHLKLAPGKPANAQSLAAMSAWPANRTIALLDALRVLHAGLQRAGNDQLSDDINAVVARAYI